MNKELRNINEFVFKLLKKLQIIHHHAIEIGKKKEDLTRENFQKYTKDLFQNMTNIIL